MYTYEIYIFFIIAYNIIMIYDKLYPTNINFVNKTTLKYILYF